jgi:hypothetical protein
MRVGSCSRAIKRDGAGKAVKKGDAKEPKISTSFIDVLLVKSVSRPLPPQLTIMMLDPGKAHFSGHALCPHNALSLREPRSIAPHSVSACRSQPWSIGSGPPRLLGL